MSELTEQDRIIADKLIDELKWARPTGNLIFVSIPLGDVLGITGMLQISLRHPALKGSEKEMAIRLIRAIQEACSERGMPTHVELMEMGFDPRNNR